MNTMIEEVTISPKTRKKWREKQNAYYESHREKWNAYQREYKKKRYAEDPEYKERIIKYQRSRIASK